MTRQAGDWIESFIYLTRKVPSPEIFRRWSALAILAGAVERKVWLNLYGGSLSLYPNLYVALVGGPGTGKTNSTRFVRQFWNHLANKHEYHLASSSLTKASFIDELSEAERHINVAGTMKSYYSLLIASNELGTFLPEYDKAFMNTLTDLWDSADEYSERRRSNNIDIVIKDPIVNFIAATTPSYLNDFIPEGAWDQGFLARTMLVYSAEKQRKDPFRDTKPDTELLKKLIADLESTTKLWGPLKVENEAAEQLSAWFQVHEEDAPTHPRLLNYIERRDMHLMKLCIISAISRDNALTITSADFERALEWLLTAEAAIPDIFKAMAKNADSLAIDETWYKCHMLYLKYNKPVVESKVLSMLRDKVGGQKTIPLLDLMQKMKLLERKVQPGIGVCYIPAEYKKKTD